MGPELGRLKDLNTAKLKDCLRPNTDFVARLKDLNGKEAKRIPTTPRLQFQ